MLSGVWLADKKRRHYTAGFTRMGVQIASACLRSEEHVERCLRPARTTGGGGTKKENRQFFTTPSAAPLMRTFPCVIPFFMLGETRKIPIGARAQIVLVISYQ